MCVIILDGIPSLVRWCVKSILCNPNPDSTSVRAPCPPFRHSVLTGLAALYSSCWPTIPSAAHLHHMLGFPVLFHNNSRLLKLYKLYCIKYFLNLLPGFPLWAKCHTFTVVLSMEHTIITGTAWWLQMT